MRKILVFIFLPALFFASCNKDEWNANKSKVMKDVAYGSDAQQKMDVYLPANRNTESTKMLIWVHGGAWSAGDKSEGASIKGALDPYLDNYAYASLNYRLYNSSTYVNPFPAQENDVNAAVEYILSQTEQWQISNSLVLAGASAGGHLVLLQAYKYNSAGNIKAVIAYYPPTELTAMYNFSLFTQLTLYSLCGGAPDTQASLYNSSSPLTYLNASSVPTVFFHGTADDVVPLHRAIR